MNRTAVYLCSFLITLNASTRTLGAVDHVTADKGTVFEYLQMEEILERTNYPIKRIELLKRLGGKKRLRQNASLTHKKGDVQTHIIDYALSDIESTVGFFLIEFILAEEPKADGSDNILSAHYYFQSATGIRFIPEPRKEEKPANHSPEPTPGAVH